MKKSKIERYHRCKKHGIHFGLSCPDCMTEDRRKKSGECLAVLYHGPGHQSKTYCQVMGEHKIHMARYGCFDQKATWRGMKKFTGYFDDPPEAR